MTQSHTTLVDLHRKVDEAAAYLRDLHKERLQCRPGCASCCIDDITVFAIEAENIASHNTRLLETGIPHARGACAFLDELNRCRIYEQRPYVCRTQGLPLRWMSENDHGEIVEMRDICPLNEEGTPIEELPSGTCWTIGPVEEQLAELQHAASGAMMTRVRLRTLFRKA
ncbi:MAG: YkgJ family cysteine cluster protein [Nitrospiraceae bacterium]|nr:YkgJ family cysteine cluster protein [Nitrospiraceae bacterium]